MKCTRICDLLEERNSERRINDFCMIRKSKKVVPVIGNFSLNVTVCGHTKKQEIKILNINKDLVNTLRVGSADIKFQENCTLQTYFNLSLEFSFKYRTVERANVASERSRGMWPANVRT